MARPPGDLAVVTATKSYSAGDVLSLARSVQSALQSSGTRLRGSRVMIPTSDPATLLAGILGVVGAGCTAIPWRRDTPEFESSQRDLLLPDAWLHFSDTVEIEWPQREAMDRPWIGDVILTTTGSTGRPKGVSLTLEQLLMNSSEVGALIELGPKSLWGLNVDLGFTSGLCHLLTAWLRRWTLFYLKNAEPSAWTDLFHQPNSGFGGSPVQLAKLADTAEPNWQPAALMSSGDFLTAPMIAKIRRALPKASI